MHPAIYREFERICSHRTITGSVLEVGATPTNSALLCMASLRNVTEKVGVDLNGPYEYRDFKIVQCNANTLECFGDGRFDAVLCNATLEHDPYFWRTIEAIKRVTRPGGQIIIGVPGYVKLRVEIIGETLRRIPLLCNLERSGYFNGLFCSTLTYQVHNYPGDYYRFSEQTMKEVMLDGCEDIEMRTIMVPPRIIGVGRKRV